MNRDTIIGFVLIAVVLIGFSWWNQPSAEEIEAARKQDSIAAAIKDNAAKQQKVEEATKKAEAEAAAKGDSSALFFSALNGEKQIVERKVQNQSLLKLIGDNWFEQPYFVGEI